MKRFAVFSAVVTLLVMSPCSAQMFDQYGGYTGLKGSNTSGFFRVEKIGDRYWLVTPENNVFWSMGVCAPVYYDSWGGYAPDLGYRPNPCSVMAKFPGGSSEWRPWMASKMGEWGMNTAAAWGDSSIPDVAQATRVVGIGSSYMQSYHKISDHFPDVWDPNWEVVCDNRCKSLASNKDNPWIIGIFPDNELHWCRPWPYLDLPDAYIGESADVPGKQHWVNVFLKGKYATVEDLNTAWGTSFADWDELLNVTEIPDDDYYPQRFEDKLDFQEEISDRYYSTVSQYIRQYDPNHLVFTARWAMWGDSYTVPYKFPFADRIWKSAGKYCDVFANNGYANFPWADEVYQHSTRVFTNARIPWMVTEENAPANDSYFKFWNWYKDTQMDRGQYYYDKVKGLMDMGVDDDPNDPGNPAKTCMGIHWFATYDEPALGRPDGEAHNNGVFNCQCEAFLPLVDTMATVNAQVYDYGVDGTEFDIPEAPNAISPLVSPLQTCDNASSMKHVMCADHPDWRHSTGSLIDDPDARKGKAWAATVSGSYQTWMLFGPYWNEHFCWPEVDCTVTFRLKASDNSVAENIARIEVVGSGAVLAATELAGTDFTEPGTYQEFVLEVTNPSPAKWEWQFRIYYYDVVDLYLDTVVFQADPPTSFRDDVGDGPLADELSATVWSSEEYDTAEAVEWAGICLGDDPIALDSLRILSGTRDASGMPVDFQLQYSDDAVTWTTIPDQVYVDYPFDGGAQRFEFDPIACKYIRVYATKLGLAEDGKYRLVLAGMDVTPRTDTSTPTFEWSYDGDASSYALLLSPVIHFPEDHTIRVEGIGGSSYTLAEPLAQGRWYWTVKAVSPDGHAGRYLRTVNCEIGDLPAEELDHTAALACEEIQCWQNVDNPETGWRGIGFGFLDDSVQTEADSSIRVALTVNSLNKQVALKNLGTCQIPFRYAGPGLDYSALDEVSFDIYPRRFFNTDEDLVTSSKYVHFRMTDLGGSVVADQAVDPDGLLPIEQWSTITVPLSGRRYQVLGIEFYVNAADDKLVWDERVYFNIDNITAGPLADMTPPTVPYVQTTGYTTDNTIAASIFSEDPETGVAEYHYAVGSAPELDDIVPWQSCGSSTEISQAGLGLSDGEVCYISAKSVNGIDVESKCGCSIPIRKVALVDSPAQVRNRPVGSWLAVRDNVVTAVFEDRIYVERPDRSCGIGVVALNSASVGDNVTVYGQTFVSNHEAIISGYLTDITSGEPLVPVASANVYTAGRGTSIQPSPINNADGNSRAYGLSNVACLVRTCGKVTYVDPLGQYFYFDDGGTCSYIDEYHVIRTAPIEDGSGHVGVKVDTKLLPVPALDSRACVTGIMAVTDVEGNCARLLRPRSFADMTCEQVDNYAANADFEILNLKPWETIGSQGASLTLTAYGNITASSGDRFFAAQGYYSDKSGTIYQVVGVEAGESYTLTAYSNVYHWGAAVECARNRIGIDPTGGIDPNSPDVIWSAWDENPAFTSGWEVLSIPDVSVMGNQATVFLDYPQQGTFAYNINCFDGVILQKQ